MTLAALYDIHGNLPALEAVLAELRREGVDRVLVGGDVVPGPMAGEALERLRGLEVPVAVLRGNGERQTLAARDGDGLEGLPAEAVEAIRWNAERLTEDQAAWLRSWPETVRLDVDGVGPVLFCHATPRNDSDIFTRETPESALLRSFDGLDAALVVCGHTHMQFDRTVGSVRVVNAGSVGMPFGSPGAYWLRLGPGVALRRTDYDLAAAADRIRRSGYPQAEAFASRDVLRPRGEAEMIAAFETVALKDGHVGTP